MFTAENGLLTVTPYLPEVFEITTRSAGDTVAQRAVISVETQPSAAFTVNETNDSYDIRTTEMTASGGSRRHRTEPPQHSLSRAGHQVENEAVHLLSDSVSIKNNEGRPPKVRKTGPY